MSESSPKPIYTPNNEEDNLAERESPSPDMRLQLSGEIIPYPPDAFLRPDPQRTVELNSVLSPQTSRTKEKIEAAKSKVLKDEEAIKKGMDRFKFSDKHAKLLARKDPREVFEEVQRNKSMKKESLQRAFVDDEEEEENK